MEFKTIFGPVPFTVRVQPPEMAEQLAAILSDHEQLSVTKAVAVRLDAIPTAGFILGECPTAADARRAIDFADGFIWGWLFRDRGRRPE